MRRLKDYLMLSVKGACMGAADVIPGVSGGTIAFIVGIYDELVGSISSVDMTALRLLLKGRLREFWKHINGNFLLSVMAGIMVSVLSLAKLMQFLLNHYPIQTWAFFFGLIVASSIFILRGVKDWKVKDALVLAVGAVIGALICTLTPTNTPDELWFIFLSGAIAICAMILPGISGSFILLILGKYEYIMGNIADFTSGVFGSNITVLVVFAVGAAVGIVSFSKFLHWLMAKYNKSTIIFFAGFIIGSLVKVWPWSNMEAIAISQFPEIAETAEPGAAGLSSALAEYSGLIDLHIGSAVAFALIGFCLITGIEVAGKYLKNRK